MQNDKHNSKNSALFQYYIISKHTFSQLQQQEIFLNSTKTKFQTTSYQKLPSATIPAWATMPTVPQKFLPPSLTLCQTAPRRHPRTTTSPKFTSSSSHQRLPPTPNFCYDRNYITIGSLHPWFFLLSRASARHQNSLSVAPPWHVVEPFCWTGSSTGSRSW